MAYGIIENIFSTFHMTYFGVPFHLMIWSKIWVFITNTDFIAFIALYIGFVLVCQMGVLGKSKRASNH